MPAGTGKDTGARVDRTHVPLTGRGLGGRVRMDELAWGMRFVVPAVTPIAGHGEEGDRRAPRPGRSGCRRDPRSTFRSGPRAPLAALSLSGFRPRPAGRARREHPGPGSRSSPSGRAGRPRARRPRAAPGPGRTPARDHPAGRTPGRWPGRAHRGRSGGCGPGRWGAAGSGCSERPCHHSSITFSDAGRLKRRAQSRRSALERSLRSDPLEVSRSVSSVALLNLLANARL